VLQCVAVCCSLHECRRQVEGCGPGPFIYLICVSDTFSCNTLQHTATHCHALHYTSTHGNKRKHTATRCNTGSYSNFLEAKSVGRTHIHTCEHAHTHAHTNKHTLTHTHTRQHANVAQVIDICNLPLIHRICVLWMYVTCI